MKLRKIGHIQQGKEVLFHQDNKPVYTSIIAVNKNKECVTLNCLFNRFRTISKDGLVENKEVVLITVLKSSTFVTSKFVST